MTETPDQIVESLVEQFLNGNCESVIHSLLHYSQAETAYFVARMMQIMDPISQNRLVKYLANEI